MIQSIGISCTICWIPGFGTKWISWIKTCLQLSTVFVIVNGSPTHDFTPTRGLRQEDPLAPFLFLIVAEGLSGLVRQANNMNLLEVGMSKRARPAGSAHQLAKKKADQVEISNLPTRYNSARLTRQFSEPKQASPPDECVFLPSFNV